MLSLCAYSPTLPPKVYTQEDHCKAVAISKEARGESLAGQRSVLQVIESRMKARGMTACDVVAQKRQFPWYKKRKTLIASREQLQQLDRIATMPNVIKSDVQYFHHKRLKPLWTRKMTLVAEIGNHRFYKER